MEIGYQAHALQRVVPCSLIRSLALHAVTLPIMNGGSIEVFVEACPIDEDAAAALRALMGGRDGRVRIAGPSMAALTLSLPPGEPQPSESTPGDPGVAPAASAAELFGALLPCPGETTEILSVCGAAAGSSTLQDGSSSSNSEGVPMRVVGTGDHILYVATSRDALQHHWRTVAGAHISRVTGFRPPASAAPAAASAGDEHSPSPEALVLTAVEEACRQQLKHPPAPVSACVVCVDAGDTTYVYEF